MTIIWHAADGEIMWLLCAHKVTGGPQQARTSTINTSPKMSSPPTQSAVSGTTPIELPSTTDNSTPVSTEKQGRSCFGCLCDMRRAVIILSLIGILLSALTIGSNYIFLFERAKDDIEKNNGSAADIQQIDDLFIINIVLSVLSIVGFVLAIIGAKKFYIPLVLVNVIYMPVGFAVLTTFIFQAAADIDELDYGFVNIVGPLIGVAMSIFVHLSFIREVHAGIMSEENYAKEEQSCCCV